VDAGWLEDGAQVGVLVGIVDGDFEGEIVGISPVSIGATDSGSSPVGLPSDGADDGCSVVPVFPVPIPCVVVGSLLSLFVPSTDGAGNRVGSIVGIPVARNDGAKDIVGTGTVEGVLILLGAADVGNSIGAATGDRVPPRNVGERVKLGNSPDGCCVC
jgi:hypothetical protein